MRNLLLTAACLGVAFSGFASSAKAGPKPGVATGGSGQRLVECRQPPRWPVTHFSRKFSTPPGLLP